MEKRTKKDPTTTYSKPSTPATEASFSIAKSLASAGSPFPFRSYV